MTVEERNMAPCLAVEQRHLAIRGQIDPVAPGGGNPLLTTEGLLPVETGYDRRLDCLCARLINHDATDLRPARSIEAGGPPWGAVPQVAMTEMVPHNDFDADRGSP